MPFTRGNSTDDESSFATLIVNGTTEELLQAFDGLTFQVHSSEQEAKSGRTITRVLRFRMEFLDAGALFARYKSLEEKHVVAIDTSGTTCKPGWKGEFCNIVATDLEAELALHPTDAADQQVPIPQFPGRTLSRGGEGTHVTATAVGKTLLPRSSAPSPDNPAYADGAGRRIQDYDSAACNARLAYFDIGAGSSPYLVPPPSLLDMYGIAYNETGARVFLNAWTSQETVWWDRNHLADDPGVKVCVYVCVCVCSRAISLP